MDKLTNILSFFAALTVATERITEAIKGLPILSGWLAIEQKDRTKEEFRKATIQILAMAVASTLTFLTRDQVSELTGLHFQGFWTHALLGAMGSGGSGMWNSLLDIVREMNQQKQILTQQLQSNPTSALSQIQTPQVPQGPVAAPVPQPVSPRVPTQDKITPAGALPATGADSPPLPPVGMRTGEQLLQLARQHLGEKYVLSVRVPLDNPNWSGPWNCSQFASWVVYQVLGKLYGCEDDAGDPGSAHAYTSYWGRDAQSRGNMISIEQAARTPGAAVLRLPQGAAMGHIVFSDGKSGTIEARSPIDGVIPFTMNGRRWDTGILVPGIAYSEGTAVTVSPPGATIYRLKDPMMTGPQITKLQEALKAAGFDPGPLDGIFGPHTHAAVVAFQASHGLVTDGEVGPQTAAVLGIQLD